MFSVSFMISQAFFKLSQIVSSGIISSGKQIKCYNFPKNIKLSFSYLLLISGYLSMFSFLKKRYIVIITVPYSHICHDKKNSPQKKSLKVNYLVFDFTLSSVNFIH